MAYMRSLSTRARLVRRCYNPSFSYILHDNDQKHNSIEDGVSQQGMSTLFQQMSFRGSFINSPAFGSFRGGRSIDFHLSSSIGPSFCRFMSTTVGGGSDNIELMSDVADVLTDTAVQTVASQASAVNEVAIAAADSFLPVAALQHLVDAVHSFTGLNWWASIALTTLMIRGITLPFVINQLKATSKFTLLRPRMEEIKKQMEDKAMDPVVVAEGQKRMQMLFKEYGVSPFTPLKGLLIQGPIFVSFFLAISNMVEKVPSFRSGGAYWFLDLTTTDSLYIFPILTGLTFLITVECNMQEGMEGNPVAGTVKKFSRVLAVATVPFTMNFPKAVFCYWVTSNIFSLMWGLVLKHPVVKKFLAIPEIPVEPATTTAPQSSFNLLTAIKQVAAARQDRLGKSIDKSLPSPADQRISSSSVMSQRLRSLEKQVKGRKKNKNR